MPDPKLQSLEQLKRSEAATEKLIEGLQKDVSIQMTKLKWIKKYIKRKQLQQNQ